MTTEDLLAEIEQAFPPVEMPSKVELRFHSDGCFQCTFLSEYLDERPGKPVTGDVIRFLHQEMTSLSAKGWSWALPHYLPYCLTPEAEYNQMETEFLVYNLAPNNEHKGDARSRLAELSPPQMRCLVHFLEWLQAHPKWNDYCPSEISQALEFVRETAA